MQQQAGSIRGRKVPDNGRKVVMGRVGRFKVGEGGRHGVYRQLQGVLWQAAGWAVKQEVVAGCGRKGW